MKNFYPQLLQLSVLIPFSIAIILFFSDEISKRVYQTIAFIGFLCPALISVILSWQYASAPKIIYNYAFYSEVYTGLQSFGISLKLGLNGFSLPLFLLAGIVGLAAGTCALFSNVSRLNLLLAFLLVMQSGLMGTFASIDIFFFYFFHELALIPTFIMIGLWGGRGRRIAAMELTIYLTLGAMLSLLGLIALYTSSKINAFDIISLRKFLSSAPLTETFQNNIFGLLLFGFGILVSLFPFHSWAPRGYAAAPTPTAMLHAGVLKKFGLYGLIQIAIPLLPEGATHWTVPLAWLALGNIFIIGLVTLAQNDLKQMIGYSSVMHMGYCFLGIVGLSSIGIGGALILMFAHGLSVALLFLLSSAIHQRTNTYDMTKMGGLCQKTPVLSAFFIVAIFASIGLPGFANFWGEIAIFISLWNFQPWMVVVAILGVVISAVYGLRAVANIFFAQPTKDFSDTFSKGEISDITLKERLPALLLVFSLLVIGFWPKCITQDINSNLEAGIPSGIKITTTKEAK